MITTLIMGKPLIILVTQFFCMIVSHLCTMRKRIIPTKNIYIHMYFFQLHAVPHIAEDSEEI